MKARLIIVASCLLLASCNSFNQVNINGSVNIGNNTPVSTELIVLGIKPKQETIPEVRTVTKEKVVYKVPNGYCPEFKPVVFLPMVDLPIMAIANAANAEESRALILDTIEKLREMSWRNRDIYNEAYQNYRKACAVK